MHITANVGHIPILLCSVSHESACVALQLLEVVLQWLVMNDVLHVIKSFAIAQVVNKKAYRALQLMQAIALCRLHRRR